MNTYLIPICDGDNNIIKSIVANSLNQAKDKLYNYLFNKYDSASSEDLEELCDELLDDNVVVGNIYELEDFTDNY